MICYRFLLNFIGRKEQTKNKIYTDTLGFCRVWKSCMFRWGEGSIKMKRLFRECFHEEEKVSEFECQKGKNTESNFCSGSRMEEWDRGALEWQSEGNKV